MSESSQEEGTEYLASGVAELEALTVFETIGTGVAAGLLELEVRKIVY